MFLINIVTDRFIGGMSRKVVGYISDEKIAKSYCENKTKELEGTYNKNMIEKYYEYVEIKEVEV